MKTVVGDLLKFAQMGAFDVILHGANCFCTMGSGIAKSIREKYPQVYEADCDTKPGDKSKLGTFTYGTATNDFGEPFYIVNAYTQFNFNRPGENKDVFEYEAFQKILDTWTQPVEGETMPDIGFPLIGCGLAGGDEKRIVGMIEKFAEKVEARGGSVTIVKFG